MFTSYTDATLLRVSAGFFHLGRKKSDFYNYSNKKLILENLKVVFTTSFRPNPANPTPARVTA